MGNLNVWPAVAGRKVSTFGWRAYSSAKSTLSFVGSTSVLAIAADAIGFDDAGIVPRSASELEITQRKGKRAAVPWFASTAN